jgi:hypothetical protein
MLSETSDGRNCTRKQAEKVKTQASKIVELLEQARELMAEDNAVQPAMKHLCRALYEAEGRATVLEDWYQRTYLLPAPERASRSTILVAVGEAEA